MRRHVTLYLPRKDGSRLMETYEAVAAQLGEMPDGVEYPEVPEIALDIWDWYFELRSAAGVGMSGPESLRYSEITSWAAIYGRTVLPVHDRFFRILDAAYINAVNGIQKKTKAGK